MMVRRSNGPPAATQRADCATTRARVAAIGRQPASLAISLPRALALKLGACSAFAALGESKGSRSGAPPAHAIAHAVILVNLAAPQAAAMCSPNERA